MSEKIKLFVLGTGSLLLGFFLGSFTSQTSPQTPTVREIRPEISIVQFQKIIGDRLQGDISGPVRIVWAEENVAEGEGLFKIPLSQIPNNNDLKYTEFPYTGNAKTMKFYPSDSYFARGVEVRYRRFFRTKQDALEEGFIPSKGVK